MPKDPYGLDPRAIHVGTVSARYFRENSAQAGLDLVQILPELITNADAAISASDHAYGHVTVSFGEPDAEFARAWRRELRRLRVPGVAEWRHELRCIDSGIGVTQRVVEDRLAELGARPELRGQRGLFGRGLREVWLAQGGGRVIGVRDDRLIEAWFFPHHSAPFAYQLVRDEVVTEDEREALGIRDNGTCIFVPLAQRPPALGRVRALIAHHVQLRPVLEDPGRDVWLKMDEEVERVVLDPPEPDPERPVLYDGAIEVVPGEYAHVVVRRARSPFPSNTSRALRRGGLVVRSGRAAHETTLARVENRPGAAHLYGEVRFEALERLQRDTLGSVRPEVVVRVDRVGLNENHPVVARLYDRLTEALEPIVADEERRAGATRLDVGHAIRSRDLEGLRTMNRVLRQLFRSDGAAAAATGDTPSSTAPGREPEQLTLEERQPPQPPEVGPERAPHPAMYFKRSPMRLHPSESRDVSLLLDADLIPPDSQIVLEATGPVRARAVSSRRSPRRQATGRWTVPIRVRARATAKPGARPTVTARVGNFLAILDIVIVSHHVSGWVTDIVRKDETAAIEAEFDETTGVVTVYEGRPEFRRLASAARAHGYKKGRFSEYVPFRMLEVEAAANAVYYWAAAELVRRRVSEEVPLDPAEYASTVRVEAQQLRRETHADLMQAFLPAEVFEAPERPGLRSV